jgi:hypothetical protein
MKGSGQQITEEDGYMYDEFTLLDTRKGRIGWIIQRSRRREIKSEHLLGLLIKLGVCFRRRAVGGFGGGGRTEICEVLPPSGLGFWARLRPGSAQLGRFTTVVTSSSFNLIGILSFTLPQLAAVYAFTISSRQLIIRGKNIYSSTLHPPLSATGFQLSAACMSCGLRHQSFMKFMHNIIVARISDFLSLSPNS